MSLGIDSGDLRYSLLYKTIETRNLSTFFSNVLHYVRLDSIFIFFLSIPQNLKRIKLNISYKRKTLYYAKPTIVSNFYGFCSGRDLGSFHIWARLKGPIPLSAQEPRALGATNSRDGPKSHRTVRKKSRPRLGMP